MPVWLYFWVGFIMATVFIFFSKMKKIEVKKFKRSAKGEQWFELRYVIVVR